ncbi:50S ribosomal protein L15 [Acidimicrobium ferrooxidans]|uniref:Large ribosomal subunit protein uL15 n=1 Tax=Acidimicrobium ferrooxidans TaxID=53635 RepID=A0ABS3AP22_9ACTN|nr:50S ribosomal protein L15 [Acidimicrobium ferrooxidans]
MLKPHDLHPAEGSKKSRKRVGRGIGGKGGKTAGRGTKGTKARSKVPIWYEGGQQPLQRRLPKLKGFTNPFRVEYQAINLDTLAELELDEVTPEALRDRGLIGKNSLVKVLGRGELSNAVNVKAHGFSASAEAAITAAGGTVEVLPKPFGGPRPPAKGNQHTNR